MARSRSAKTSFDEQVGRIAISRLTGEAKQVATMRGLPPDVRFATPEEELALYDQWDDRVDPKAVLMERFQKHIGDGLDEDHALAEAILETSAAGFSHRLKMAQGAGRLSLTEQTKWLEDMAAKSSQARLTQPPPLPSTPAENEPFAGAPDGAPSSLPSMAAPVAPPAVPPIGGA